MKMTINDPFPNVSDFRVYERDVFMSSHHCLDLKTRLGAGGISLPQVFIHGHLLGVSDHCSTALCNL